MSPKWRIGAAFLLVLLGGCEFIPGTSAYQESKAKSAVARTLIDPSSAQFRNVETRPNAVCGEVNGKNRMGAYVGFVRFYVDVSSWDPVLDPQFDPQNLYSARSLCSSLSSYGSASCARQIEEEARQGQQAAFDAYWLAHCLRQGPRPSQMPFDPTRPSGANGDLTDTNIQYVNAASNQGSTESPAAEDSPLDFDGEPAEPPSNDVQPSPQRPPPDGNALNQNWLDRVIGNTIK